MIPAYIVEQPWPLGLRTFDLRQHAQAGSIGHRVIIWPCRRSHESWAQSDPLLRAGAVRAADGCAEGILPRRVRSGPDKTVALSDPLRTPSAALPAALSLQRIRPRDVSARDRSTRSSH